MAMHLYNFFESIRMPRRHKQKTRKRKIRRRKSRSQRGGRDPIIVDRPFARIPEADDRPTILFRSVDADDPHGASSATMNIPEAEYAAEHYGPYA